MASRRSTAPTEDPAEVIAWYRERLAEPARFPWEESRWDPVRIGPTWQTDGRGRWLLPEASIGWQQLGWCGTRLQHRRGVPWRFTLEQARWLLWWGSVDESGRFNFRDAILQRLKGWGKDPMGAVWCAVEAFGPARFLEWDGDRPLATDVPDAWVQTAAVSLEQTKNTMRLFPGLFTAEAKAEYQLSIGKEVIHGLGDTRMIQAVTSSPLTLEGARATAVLKNETQHWKANNDGHEMAAVIERNATKSSDGAARTVAITNAYEPSEESVAQHDREAYDQAVAGDSLTTGILYDSLEAPPHAPLSPEEAPAVVSAIRGDSVWLVPERIVASILDTRNPPSRSRRFWYNQIVAAEDAWVDPADFDACAESERGVGRLILADSERQPGRWVVFFDGSKSDDATGIVAVRLDDGHAVTLGMWQRPPKGRPDHDGWVVPRSEVDDRMVEVFERLTVVALFADPSHTKDDETQERFWDDTIDEWHRRWKAQLVVWAEPGKHSTMWDMTSPARVAEFTAAAERCEHDVSEGLLTHDGDSRLRSHVRNARRYPNRYGVSLWKGHRESARKVDLAVCLVGARMVRRLVLNTEKSKKVRSGKVW